MTMQDLKTALASLEDDGVRAQVAAGDRGALPDGLEADELEFVQAMAIDYPFDGGDVEGHGMASLSGAIPLVGRANQTGGPDDFVARRRADLAANAIGPEWQNQWGTYFGGL